MLAQLAQRDDDFLQHHYNFPQRDDDFSQHHYDLLQHHYDFSVLS